MQTPIHWNLIGRSMTAAPPVIAQQYSFATVVSEHFHSRKEIFSARFKTLLLLLLLLLFKAFVLGLLP
jgi:hypothetical protein